MSAPVQGKAPAPEGTSAADAARATRHAYEAWHDGLPFSEAAETPWFIMVRRHLDPPRDLEDRVVLEVGCGRGELSWWLAGRPRPPRRVIAGDLSMTAVHKGATRGGTLGGPAAPAASTGSAAGTGTEAGAIAWQVVDISRLALPDACCDTVISCETVEHVPSPRAAIAELARVLRPGGRLFLTTPNYLNAVGLYRAYRRLVGSPYQEAGQPINRLMTLPRTLWLVRRAGLRIERVDGCCHPLPLPGRALEMKLLARCGPLGRWSGVQSLVLGVKPDLEAR